MVLPNIKKDLNMSHHVEAKVQIGLQSFHLFFGDRELANVMDIPVNTTQVYADITSRVALSAMRSCAGEINAKLIDCIDELACWQGDMQGEVPNWCTVELSHYG